MNVQISADSTCDLSQELLDSYGIRTVPLYIVKGDRSYLDGLEITPEDVFAYIDSGKGTCSTAAVSVGDYIEYFGRLLETHDEVVHLTICSDMSSCYQNAVQAAEEFPGRVFPVDSRSLSTGIGQLALCGAELARAGKSGAEIQALLNEKREKLEVSFVLNTLSYLHKGGRCSGIAALGANLLNLKPCIEVHGGKMEVGRKYRGNLLKCALAYVNDQLANRSDLDYSRIFITHTAEFPDDVFQAVKEAVIAAGPWEEILETSAGCTISSHCGPNCIGVLFFHK